MMEFVNKIFIVVAVAICSCFVACNDSADESTVKGASCSEIKDLNIEILDDKETAEGYFTLTAYGKWSVSSDKMWVTFSTSADGEFYYDIQGNAGVYTVYVKVNNTARDFAESTAVVKLSDAAGEQKVGAITRPAKQYEFDILSEDGAIIDNIAINAKATQWVCFDANFECGIIDYPSWLMEPVLENNGYRFNVIEDSVPKQRAGTLVVGNSDNTKRYSFGISYIGMEPTAIEISGDSPWGWVVSLDGQEFKKDKSSLIEETEDPVIYGALNMNVVCRDYSYKFVFTENVSETLSIKEGDDAWIRAVRDVNNPTAVSVTVDEYKQKSSRSGYLFAVPDALYENFKSVVEAGKDTIVWMSGENRKDSISIYNYVLADVIQKDEGFKVFQIADDGTETEIPCEVDEEADYYMKLSSELTITDIMACDVSLGKSYLVDTKLTVDDWLPENIALYDINGEEIRVKTWIPERVGVLGDDGYYKINITVPSDNEWFEENGIDRNVVLRLRTSDNVNIKALVLRVQE